MNPYEARPENMPATDLYVDIPCYGRYHPTPDDFVADPEHLNSTSARSRQYWASVLQLCTEANRIFPSDDQGRDVFALGKLIVKSSHLHHAQDDKSPVETDYTYADANEVQAIAVAKPALKGIRIPEIYFSGRINDRQVLVQERLPGVGLNVAWPYLNPNQRASFKKQAREVLRQLHAVQPSDGRKRSSHVVPDPDITTNGRINCLEADLLFSGSRDDLDLDFMHNDLTQSNLIVDSGVIVGLIDWEMAGFIGWRTAGEIHRRIRTPQREHFAKANVSEDELRDMMYWNDLYDEGMPGHDAKT